MNFLIRNEDFDNSLSFTEECKMFTSSSNEISFEWPEVTDDEYEVPLLFPQCDNLTGAPSVDSIQYALNL